MTKILIEHPGTEKFNKLSQDMQDVLEYEFGLDSDVVIGNYDDKLILYIDGKDPKKIGEFNSIPERNVLGMYIRMMS